MGTRYLPRWEGDVKRSFIFAAFAATIAAAPANAQPVAADLLPAYEVATIIASMGMRPVGRPAWIRGRYVVAAIDRHGREVNIVLDARDGQVIAVRPLARNSFGPPPSGYPPRPGPDDPMDGRAPAPPGAVPNAPSADDDEFFDNERQQGSLTPPRAPARTVPQEPATTGSVTRGAPAERKDTAARAAAKDTPPMPRPRPVLAKANDAQPAAGARPVASGGQKAAAQPDARNAKAEAANPEAAKPDAAKKDVRVIDLSKKPVAKPEDKPGEVIRF
jgi:hypothetical protein